MLRTTQPNRLHDGCMNQQQPSIDDCLSAYTYDLPEHLIAREPRERGSSRLLLYDRVRDAHSEHLFAELPSLLPPGALLVANNSRVVPARLMGSKATGGKLEFLLLSPLPLVEAAKHTDGNMYTAPATALIKPAKGLRPGESYVFGGELTVTVVEKGEFGQCDVQCRWQGSLADIFARHGALPLPPYMHRQAQSHDSESYQTVFSRADRLGSVAAPTAGLHFTRQMRQQLAAQGFGWAEATLYVGYGTFSPVRVEDVREHRMHPEYVELDAESVQQIVAAKQQGRPVIAVGTTSVRLLEGIAALHGGNVMPYKGWVNMFIRPGFKFQVVDGLITNFHLPQSTLLMLVSAMANRQRVLDLYRLAVHNQYAFFSYGDAMFIR